MIVVIGCPSGGTPVGGVLTLYAWANGLAARGHEVHLVHLAIWGREIHSLAELDRYRFEPAIVHHFAGYDLDALPDADVVVGTGFPERVGLPVLFLQGFELLHPHLERQGLRSRCLKLCVASWLVDVGVTYGVAPEQLQVVHNGLDREVFRQLTPLDERPIDVAVRYIPHHSKGWPVARAALEALHARRPGLRVVVFGTDEPPLGLPDWMEMVVDPPIDVLVGDIYNRAKTFLLASGYEGFGLPAIEAMACGCAVVTTDNGGSRDYAVPGETALVAPPRDPEGLAAHLDTLLGDDALRRRLAAAGAAFVERFDWEATIDALEGHLERYVADPDRYRGEPGPESDETDLPEGVRAARLLAATVPDGVAPHPDVP